MWLKDKTIMLVCVAMTMLVVGLAVVGGVRAYSPVPYWDMWDGYIGFFLRVADGDFSIW